MISPALDIEHACEYMMFIKCSPHWWAMERRTSRSSHHCWQCLSRHWDKSEHTRDAYLVFTPTAITVDFNYIPSQSAFPRANALSLRCSALSRAVCSFESCSGVVCPRGEERCSPSLGYTHHTLLSLVWVGYCDASLTGRVWLVYTLDTSTMPNTSQSGEQWTV